MKISPNRIEGVVHIRRLALDALAYVAAGAIAGCVAFALMDAWTG